MEPIITTTPISNKSLWAGRILGGFGVVFMLFDAVIHIMNIAPVREAFTRLGIPDRLAVSLGVVVIACVALYVIPRTATLGAVLLTGYLGGAVFAHLRIGEPIFFPFIVAAMFWGSLVLRDPRVRTLARATLFGEPTAGS